MSTLGHTNRQQPAGTAWVRWVGVGIICGVVIAYTASSQYNTLTELDLAKPQRAESSGYGCLEPLPIPKASITPLVDATDDIGLRFNHCAGPPGSYYVPESVGCGGAWADFDGDGRVDLLLVNSQPSPDAVGEFPAEQRMGIGLYRMNEEGRLVDVSEGSGIAEIGYGVGCACGDVDNDGDIDVYITCVGQDKLFLNLGEFQFRDVTTPAGFSEDDWGTGVSFFDYDRDGLLDLLVVNYTSDPEYDHRVACGFGKSGGLVSYCGPHKFQPTVDRLYHNEGVVEKDEWGAPHPVFAD
ncbi:MAG: VCBS repeat-containing protein, partial [Planctomycetaceae bacterium]|nr:VCBS repeat-containing protein [Planctomycetaceae bacterium]